MDEKKLIEFLEQLEGDSEESVNQLYQYLEQNDLLADDEEEDIVSRGAIEELSFEKVKGKDFLKVKRIRRRDYVRNDSKTWSYQPDDYYRPLSIKGVAQAIQAAKKDKLKVRAIGSKHSFSQVIAIGKPSDDTWDVVNKYGNDNRPGKVIKDVKGAYLDLTQTIHAHDDENADPVTQAPLDRLKSREDKNKYFNVLNGLKVSMVNHLLCASDEKNADFTKPYDTKEEPYRSLYNTGGGAIQRYAGAFSTGTHGSGGFLSTYHDTVRSILLVDSDGEIHRIEPADGITNLDKHNAYYNEHSNEVPVNLIQNDDTFNSTIVSIGCFGIIYSVIIEVMPMTRLYEQGFEHKGAWSPERAKEFTTEIANGYEEMYRAYEDLENPSLEDIRGIQDKLVFDYFYINPYLVKKSKKDKDKEKGNDAGNDIEVGEEYKYSSYIRKTNKYTKIKSQGKVSHRKIWPTIIAKYKIAADIAKIIFNAGNSPKANLIEKSLNTMKENEENKDRGYVDLSYKVWNQGTGKMAGVGASIEYATPIENLADILDGLLELLQREAKSNRSYYLNAPIAIRFVKAGNGYLAPNYKEYYPRDAGGTINKNKTVTTRIWCYIELITIPGGGKEHKAKQLELYKFLQDYLIIKGCRPHWGLNFGYPFNKNILSELYPKFDRWLATYKKFNKDGRFDNQLTINAGLRDGKPKA